MDKIPMSDLIQAERDKTFQAEALMNEGLKTGVFQAPEMRVEHYFSLGLYARELYIPKGTILVGKLHKYPQLNILVKGEISVIIDGEVKRLKAPFVLSSPAGTKRIAQAHEDTIWITVLATEETDVELIEKHFVANSEVEYLEFCKQLALPLG